MKLNKKNSGLPEWPDIRLDEENGWFEVSGKHVSYRRYLLAQWLMRFVFFLPFGLLLFRFHNDLGTAFKAALVFGFPYLIFAAFVMMMPMPQMIARVLFPRFTSVRFTAEKIWINGKTFDAPGDMNIQFRAQRTALPKHKFNRIAGLFQAGRAPKHESDKLKFRVIEMIYGHQLVPLTTVADEDRAAQFALALQVGLGLAKSPATTNPAVSKETARAREFDDALPV